MSTDTTTDTNTDTERTMDTTTTIIETRPGISYCPEVDRRPRHTFRTCQLVTERLQVSTAIFETRVKGAFLLPRTCTLTFDIGGNHTIIEDTPETIRPTILARNEESVTRAYRNVG